MLEIDNGDKPFRAVHHARLQRVDGSTWTSQCIVCPDGLLLVMRKFPLATILEYDVCTVCDQTYQYLDYKEIPIAANILG